MNQDDYFEDPMDTQNYALTSEHDYTLQCPLPPHSHELGSERPIGPHEQGCSETGQPSAPYPARDSNYSQNRNPMVGTNSYVQHHNSNTSALQAGLSSSNSSATFGLSYSQDNNESVSGGFHPSHHFSPSTTPRYYATQRTPDIAYLPSPMSHGSRMRVSNMVLSDSFQSRAAAQHPIPSSPAEQSASSAFALTPASPQSQAQSPTARSPHMEISNRSDDPTESTTFHWNPTAVVSEGLICADVNVNPTIHCRVEKGFFQTSGDGKWTCYRRNYFAVQCSFELHGSACNEAVFLKHHGKVEQVKAFGIRLSAAVDGSNGKGIELIQHTPKRDNGPKTKVEIVKLAPVPSNAAIPTFGMQQASVAAYPSHGQFNNPYLPLQSASEFDGVGVGNSQAHTIVGSYGYGAATASQNLLPTQSTSHTFDRVQFKQATANNGKRRASQQYFHLMVELWADVRQTRHVNPVWVKVAYRVSEKIVVRGRSPSHYQNEGHRHSGPNGGSAGGSTYGFPPVATFGSLSSGYHAYPASGTSQGIYRQNNYTTDGISPLYPGESTAMGVGALEFSDATNAWGNSGRNTLPTHGMDFSQPDRTPVKQESSLEHQFSPSSRHANAEPRMIRHTPSSRNIQWGANDDTKPQPTGNEPGSFPYRPPAA